MPSKPSRSPKRSRYAKKSATPTKHESEEFINSEETTDEDEDEVDSEDNRLENSKNKYPTLVHIPSPRPPSSSFQKYNQEKQITSTTKRRNLKRNELISERAILESAKHSNLEAKHKNLGALDPSRINVISKGVLFLSPLPKKISLTIILLFVYFLYWSLKADNQSSIDISLIKEKFPQQDPQLWRAIVTGIDATFQEEYPTSYLFLFESEAEETTKKLVAEVSKYAVCRLSTCGYQAIDFQQVLKSSNFSNINDYGSVLSHLKSKLENSGLMVVENLDEVPEKFALAFHNFCDEISPLVKKSAFFFTMKVDKFNESLRDDLRYTEKILQKKWRNIEEDKFVPLFTRISSMPLRVYQPNVTEV
ncbi:uncharacterized protein LOC123313021 isoform X2 [Coccinella septempunctata]|uniref:uncharacterized protein LOC123313021 isoform X2 n=1 Tax=Coccinella septempunctata TaxID=41139 RepID=UPI001D06AC62|nr:uncharacterized protein LOC123313021 isoform X2 [Coccinella septempunctata]